MGDFEYRANHGQAPGDQYDRAMEQGGALVEQRGHDLDGEEARTELRRLLTWWYHERERQAANRLEMATDADFYELVGDDNGVFGCMSLLACHDFCPKDLPLKTQIAFVRRKMAEQGIKGTAELTPPKKAIAIKAV